jgi:fused signal recognition particle receptor
MAFFSKSLDKLKGALRRTAEVLNTDVRTLFVPGRQIDDAFLAEVEESLVRSDMGVANVDRIVGAIRNRWRLGRIRNAGEAGKVMRDEVRAMLTAPRLAPAPGGDEVAKSQGRPAGAGLSGPVAVSSLPPKSPADERELRFAASGPTVILVAGINGAGKTTSIAKLCWLLKTQMGKKVMVAAGDTFRAGAVHQLGIWAERIGVDIVRHKQGSDPAAVAYDACEAAKSRGIDVLIVDTAGRLHTQDHLMRELTKIRDVVAKRIDGAPHEVLLVLDATTGQNAILQAKNFGQAINVTGIVLTKWDGTAKGGVILAVKSQLDIPVKFLGLGEREDDIESFDPERFLEALFGEKA